MFVLVTAGKAQNNRKDGRVPFSAALIHAIQRGALNSSPKWHATIYTGISYTCTFPDMESKICQNESVRSLNVTLEANGDSLTSLGDLNRPYTQPR